MSIRLNQNRIKQTFSSTHHRWLMHSREEVPTTLMQALAEKLPHIPEHEWLERMKNGGVFINGVPKFIDEVLPVPCKLEYYETKLPFSELKNIIPQFKKEWILYEDETLLVVFKPAGLACLPAREQLAYNLKTYLQDYLGSNEVHMPSRLDLSTAGILTASKDLRFHDSLQRLYTNRAISKIYLAQYSTKPAWQSSQVLAWIGKHPEHPVMRTVVPNHSPFSKNAETHFQFLAESREGKALVSARPLTGRTHQIRVHSAWLGFPLVGDNFYGGDTASELSLLSYRIKCSHPATQKPLEVTLPENLYPTWLVPFRDTLAPIKI